jgi:hypothetical protein
MANLGDDVKIDEMVEPSDHPVVEKVEQTDVNAADENIVDDNGSPIDAPVPDQEGLNKLREFVMKLSPEERAQFLSNIASNYGVNPQHQRFSPASQEQILKEKLRRRKNQLRDQRIPRSSKKLMHERKMDAKKKHDDKMKGTAYLSPGDAEPVPDNAPSMLSPNPPGDAEPVPDNAPSMLSPNSPDVDVSDKNE